MIDFILFGGLGNGQTDEQKNIFIFVVLELLSDLKFCREVCCAINGTLYDRGTVMDNYWDMDGCNSVRQIVSISNKYINLYYYRCH